MARDEIITASSQKVYSDLVNGQGCSAYSQLHLFRDAALKKIFSDIDARAKADPATGLKVTVNNHMLPFGGEMITVDKAHDNLLTYATNDELPSAHLCNDLPDPLIYGPG